MTIPLESGESTYFFNRILHTFVHFLGPAGPKVVIPYESGEGEGRFASRNT